MNEQINKIDIVGQVALYLPAMFGLLNMISIVPSFLVNFLSKL